MDPHELYGLPLERFTEERNALAKALRHQGRRDEAARVAKLRKPSLAAWAVNQLVRTQRRDVGSLFAAGDALASAQTKLLAGRSDPNKLRQALDAEREAVEELTARARGLLSAEGHELTPAMLERVSETLHAAALDAGARAEIQDGCLVREVRHIGVGALGASTVAARERSDRQRVVQRKSSHRNSASENQRARLEGARKQEREARREVERASRELRAAQQRHERIADELRHAEDALARAREHAERAAQAHAQAQEGLDRL